MARVELQELTVRFGDVVAVDRTSLDFADGEFVVLLGPSGCGKTTTLRCIAGLESASAGRILFNGEAVEHLSPKDRQVAMVFQFVSLYPHLSIAENIAFPLKARGERGPEVGKKVARMADIFDLRAVLKKRPRALPPGMWQKAALARAVVREPKVLLLDEPLSAIDEQFREEMRWELRHLQKELGMTTIHVTHDQREAMSLADRVVLMRDGEVVQQGTPEDLYDRPTDLFAAHFIGSPSMNLIPARIENGTLRIGASPLVVPERLRAALPSADGALTVGARPHGTRVSRPGEKGIVTTIGAIASVGREALAEFELGGVSCKGLIADETIASGEQAEINFDPAQLLFFDDQNTRIPL